MPRARLNIKQSLALLGAIAIELEQIGQSAAAGVLKSIQDADRDTFNVADIIREQVLAAEEARREAQGPQRKAKA